MAKKKKSVGLEATLKDLKTPPKKKHKGVPYFSRFAHVSTDLVLRVIGFDNYREHTRKGVNELSKSINKEGLLEPILVSYNTRDDKWHFIDGEGRFWACYQLGADEIPIEIYYDVPKTDRIRMKIAANATKTKIDPEDLSIFAKNLYLLFMQYYARSNKIQEYKKAIEYVGEVGAIPKITIKNFAEIIGRHPSTVAKYFLFANMHQKVIDYVLDHREQNLFSRAVKIGRKIKDDEEQKKFFYEIMKYEKIHGGLNNKQFNDNLSSRIEELKRKEKFTLKFQEKDYKYGRDIIRQLFNEVGTTIRYVDAFSGFVQFFPDVKSELKDFTFEHTKGPLKSYLSYLKQRFNNIIPYLSDTSCKYINSFLKTPQKNFRDIIFEQAKKRRTKIKDEKIISAIGDKIKYIPTNQIRRTKKQPRSYFRKESIDKLAKEIGDVGQLKPGLIRQTGIHKGKPTYTVIYGSSRLEAVRKANVSVFKAFVRNDLSDIEIAILQCMEDLSEQDTAVERAKVLYKQYQLMKLQAEQKKQDYSKQEFIKDFSHLTYKKTLVKAIEFMESEGVIKNLAASGMIGYDAAIKINRLPKEKIFETIYSVMASEVSSKDLDKMIKRAEGERNQESLFKDIPKSFKYVIKRFEDKSEAPFNYLFDALNKRSKKVVDNIISNNDLLIQYARFYKSLERLENTLEL